MDKLKTTIFLLQSRRRPQHQRGHGDGSPVDNHRQQQRSVAGGLVTQGVFDAIRIGYHRTHNLDSPSDIREKQPSNNLRQKACYEQRVASSLSEALSEPILLEKLVHRQYLPDKGHVLGCTSSCNSWARAG